MGNKALSHDSVFIFESAPGNVTGDILSQENIPGRVKTLQVRTSSPRQYFCFLSAVSQESLLLDSFSVFLRILLTEVSKAKFATFGSVLPLGSWIFEQFWCFQPCPDLTVCDVNPVHELLEAFLIVSSSNGIYILYFIATAFGLRPFIYTVMCLLHCCSLNIICVTLFDGSGWMFPLYMVVPVAV